MQVLNLKSNHKPIREYYKTLQQLDKLGINHELGIKGTFEDILKSCCSQLGWNYAAEQTVKINNNTKLSVVWNLKLFESKDTVDEITD